MSDNSIDRETNGYPRVGKTTTPRFIPAGGALKSEMMQGCWHNMPTGTAGNYYTYMGTSTKGTENE